MNMHATAAHDWCQADGANVHLPIPRSQEENDLYNSVFASLNENAFWLGINDADSEGQWKTFQGDTQTYFDWGSSEPAGTTATWDYVYSSKITGKWHNIYDATDATAICTYII